MNYSLCNQLLAVVKYDGELSGQAYAILAVMLLLIVGGLSWCFYRAIKANSSQADDQRPDEV